MWILVTLQMWHIRHIMGIGFVTSMYVCTAYIYSSTGHNQHVSLLPCSLLQSLRTLLLRNKRRQSAVHVALTGAAQSTDVCVQTVCLPSLWQVLPSKRVSQHHQSIFASMNALFGGYLVICC